MRPLQTLLLCCCLLLITCVDPVETTIDSSLNVLLVDGTITDLTEPQIIRLNRSRADAITGQPGYVPVTKAAVAVVVDSSQIIPGVETTDGNYQLPADFKGQVGHAYKLRFKLSDGSTYESTSEIMQPVAPISQVRANFNATSLSTTERLNNVYPAAHDFYVDFVDPAAQTNYYRWDWIDWERQEWCSSCNGGRYQIKDAQGKLLDNCVSENITYVPFDYNCRTPCWQLLYSRNLMLFDDRLSNGQTVKALRIGQVPLYSKEHCLVEIRQNSLTRRAYTYFNQLKEQTSNSGGLATGQPALLVGNVSNLVAKNDPVVGYFSVCSVSSYRYWLTRSDASGFAPGLFMALYGREPRNEPSTERDRPPLAVCVSSESRSPVKPQGWQD